MFTKNTYTIIDKEDNQFVCQKDTDNTKIVKRTASKLIIATTKEEIPKKKKKEIPKKKKKQIKAEEKQVRFLKKEGLDEQASVVSKAH